MAELTQVDRFLYAASMKTYLREYRDAIALLSEAMAIDPTDPRLYRQRGHRWLTLREFGNSEADLLRAADLLAGTPDQHEFFRHEVEQDLVNIVLDRLSEVAAQQMPVNQQTISATEGLYKSNLHFSVWYHLGIVRFLIGNYAQALDALARADDAAIDDSSRIAVTDWCYLALARDHRVEEAENLLLAAMPGKTVDADYIHYDWRIRMYRGELSPDEILDRAAGDPVALATHGYGVVNFYLRAGRIEDARRVLDRVLAAGDHDAFGYIAAETDRARWAALTDATALA